ncbi:MAG: glycosyltransferase family 2 protein [Thermoplasmata archaeon]|nr:glycosyltransferase family 2 protein [Thermoplasmata archaeon]
MNPPGPAPSGGIGAAELERFRGAFAVVILPTLNEEKGLARTLSELPLDRFNEPGQRVVPLIIDGGSTDGTLEVARQWGVPVLRQTSKGKGGAMLEAIAWVYRQKIPFVVVLDADATYPPDRILPTIDLLRGGTDLVIGVRRPVWGPPSDLKDLVHRVGNLVMSYTSSFLSRRTILDLCSGFWGVSTQRFMELGMDDQTFAIEAELVLKSIRRGLNLQQIPIHYRERLGTAKLRAVHDGGQILLAIFQNARPSPLPGTTDIAPAPWGRDLLAIGLSLGISGAVVECAPTDAVEAADIARFLRRNLPETRVKVGSFDSGAGSNLPPVMDAAGGPRGAPSPLVVSLPSAVRRDADPRSMTVSIRNHHRQLTIELPSAEPDHAAEEGSPGGWARAGGWMAASRPHRDRFPSLLVVTSRLNFERERQQETLLTANGFRLLERPAEKDELAPPRPLDVVPSSTTNPR